MSYCLNPDCLKPKNPDDANFCLTCGTKLLLKDRYRAIQALGRGGSSRTFKALDQDRLNHPCVIKLFMLPPDQDQKATDLFNQEAVRLYELGKHDLITDLYAHFELEDRLYLVQEYIDGQTLLNELHEKVENTSSPHQESDIKEILAGLLPVLQFIHNRGVIHRDIKPANIVRRRSDGKLVLIDFGVAKQATVKSLEGKGTMIGTLGYAPAEQLQAGAAYPASDLYALGATCIHLLTGMHPFNLYNPLEGCLMWREHLPEGTTTSPQLGKILDNLLKNSVKDRYQSALEALQDLKSAVALPNGLDVLLDSERGIDYTKLRDLLAAGKWKEADEETRQKMLEVMGQQQRGYLDNEDIEKFPCKDFRTINQLWVHHSNDYFGFSVQKRIWIEEGGKPEVYDSYVYEKFGDRVGWRVNESWKLYSDLTFSLNAPPGHLPLGLSIGWGVGAMELVGVEGAVEVDRLFSLVETCQL
ncbi:MAG TPA: GUN4 domain-containing protein [Coleofasciculaceae cyanobacterium]|jgi:serine/threonine protein kinase